VVMVKKEHEVVEASGDVERLLVEREHLEKAYAQKYDSLVRGLHREQEKARDTAAEKRKELERSLELERETTQILGEEEGKNRALRCTLDRTVAQLNAVKTEMLQYQAAAEARGIQFTAGATPRLQMTHAKIEASLREKDELREETAAMEEEAMAVQAELRRQRAYTAKLEDFLRRLTSGPQSRHLVDQSSRKEATRLLNIAARRNAEKEDLDPIVTTQDGATAIYQTMDSQTLNLLRSLDTNRDGYVSSQELNAGLRQGLIQAAGSRPEGSTPHASPAEANAAVGPESRGPPGYQAARRAAEDAVMSGLQPIRQTATAF